MLQSFFVAESALRGHLVMVVIGVIEPLLTVGQPLAGFIDHNHGVAREVIEQRRWMVPSQTHQSPHSLRGAAFKELLQGLFTQQSIEPLRHRFPQLIGDERAKSCRRETQLIHWIERALAGGIELAKFVELFSEKLQTNGQLAADWINVNDVAAPAPGSFLVNG